MKVVNFMFGTGYAYGESSKQESIRRVKDNAEESLAYEDFPLLRAFPCAEASFAPNKTDVENGCEVLMFTIVVFPA